VDDAAPVLVEPEPSQAVRPSMARARTAAIGAQVVRTDLIGVLQAEEMTFRPENVDRDPDH
jgi:hypothetical protein